MAGAFFSGHGAAAHQLPASLGQLVSAQSLSVVLASDYMLPVTITSAVNNPLFTELTDGTTAYVGAKTGQFPTALGQTTKAASLSVALASDQGTLNVSVQNATLAVTQSGTWTVRAQDGSGNSLSSTSGALNVNAAQLPTTIGSHLSAASLSVVIASDSSVAATQSGTWTFTSSQLPTTLGQTTMAASTSVAIASNQSAIPASQSGTWNIGTVTAVTGITNALPAGANVIGGVTQSGAWSITQTGIDYNTGLAGATTQRVTEAGRAKAWLARNDYTSTSVTTGAYVQLVASTSAATTRLRIFDSSGSAMIIATGGAGSEVDQLYIPPGGFDSPIEFNIASGTRVSLKALDATAAVGQIVVTALS